MQLLSLLAIGGIAGTTFARSGREAAYAKRNIVPPAPRYGVPSQPAAHVKREAKTIIPQTEKTASKSLS
jgi:hypothetical protein